MRTSVIVILALMAAGPALAQNAGTPNSPSQSTATTSGAGNGTNSAPEAMANGLRDAAGKPLPGKGAHNVKAYRNNRMPSSGATQEPNGSNTARDEYSR